MNDAVENSAINRQLILEKESIYKIADTDIEEIEKYPKAIQNLLLERRNLCKYCLETSIEENKETALYHIRYINEKLKLYLNIF